MRKITMFFLFTVPFFLLLTACGNMLIEVENDGSGEVQMEVPSGGMISADMIKEELESEFDDNEGLNRLSVDDKDDFIEVTFQFDNISNVDPDAYQIPISDYVVAGDSRIDELVFNGDAVEFTEDSSAILLQLPSGMNDFDSVRIVLPGEVVAHTENLAPVEKNTVEINSSGQAYVVYESGADTSTFILGGIIVLAVIGGFLYFKRKKKNPQSNVQTEKEGEANA